MKSPCSSYKHHLVLITSKSVVKKKFSWWHNFTSSTRILDNFPLIFRFPIPRLLISHWAILHLKCAMQHRNHYSTAQDCDITVTHNYISSDTKLYQLFCFTSSLFQIYMNAVSNKLYLRIFMYKVNTENVFLVILIRAWKLESVTAMKLNL